MYCNFKVGRVNKIKRIVFSGFVILILFFLSCENQRDKKTIEIFKEESLEDIEEHINIDTIKYTQQENKSAKKYFEFTRGLYLTAYTVASEKFPVILDSAVAAGINTIVFDLKNMNGKIFFSTPHMDSLRRERTIPIINIPKVVKTLQKRDMRAVARIVMFHDQYIAEVKSNFRPQRMNGEPWIEKKQRKPSWLDPSHPEVQEELLDVIKYAAKNGVDEIQMDYIRFPTQGNISEAVFCYQKEDSILAIADTNYVKRLKTDIIVDFVKQAKEICVRYNVTLTADIFAIVAWQRENDIQNTGQEIEKITEFLDSIHPMVYSSHFSEDFGFRENVYNEPYFIVYKATKLAIKHTKSNCKIIPYIQANPWKVNFEKDYIISQIRAVEDAKASGFMLWNSSNKYFKTLKWIKNYYKEK